jgi:hypothetical protein
MVSLETLRANLAVGVAVTISFALSAFDAGGAARTTVVNQVYGDIHSRGQWGTILPSLVCVYGIAPNCVMSIWVSAQIMIAETLVVVCCIFTPHLR